MGLREYDTINDKVNKTKSWIYPRFKIIYSKELVKDCSDKQYKYYYLAKRYEPNINDYKHFIIVSAEILDGASTYIKQDDYGRLKFDIRSMFEDLGFKITDKSRNINLKLVTLNEDKNYSIYEIET